MLEYYSQHPILAVIVIAAALFAVWALLKASQYSKKRSSEANELIEKLKEQNKLQNEFAILSNSVITEADSENLFRGIGLNLQKKVSDSKDMEREFGLLNDEQKAIYSLYTFYEDSEEGMSNFFKLNSQPVTGIALEYVKMIFNDNFASLFVTEYNAYDPDNEDASCILSEIEETDKKAAPFIADGTVGKLCGDFIKANKEKFI